ncbi:MAG: glycerophosphodiester phosphodiesterase [Desulfobacterales bacterium]|nr:glycerophosphodiester phosphodiesterase [Desulfobacterales bacterium]
MTRQNKTKIIAHRGNCEGLTENSETAFKQSIAYRVDGIETDVQLTKDNVPVIFHDRISLKLTGTKKWISSYTFDELLQFNIKNEKILTLTKLLKLFSKKTSLYIEIKSGKTERASGRSRLLTHKVVKQVLNIDPEYQKNISILSFDPDVLEQVSSISDKIKCVLNLNEYNKYDKWCIQREDILNKKFSYNHLAGLCINQKEINSTLINFAHAHNLKVFTYSCNTEKQLKRLLTLGLDGIMTDKAEWLTKRMKNETGS